MRTIQLIAIVPPELAHKRLDQALAILFPEHSRARMQDWIKRGYVKVDGNILRASIEKSEKWQAQEIPLNIVYEDEDIIIINKPIGLVVHPGAGCKDNTLLNALLHHCSELAAIPRAGIIHRLDKDTSGLLVIAKNLEAHTKLVNAMQERKIKREYEAIVYGVITTGGTISEPIGRHPNKRTHMAVVKTGKPAVTHYRVIKRFTAHTHIRVILETGRTHQIRVHMTHIGYPLVGDTTYKGRNKVANFPGFTHQALHAKYLSLTQPRTGKLLEWEIELPEDMKEALSALDFRRSI